MRILQLAVRLLQTQTGLALDERVDDEENGNQTQGSQRAYPALAGEIGLLLHYLGFLLLGVIDNSQLGSLVSLRQEDGTVQGIAYLHTHRNHGVRALGTDIGAELGQVVFLDVLQREAHTIVMHLVVQVFQVPGSLRPAPGSHEVLAALDVPVACMGILGLQGGLVSTGSLLRIAHRLKHGSPVEIQAGTLLVHVVLLGIGLLLIKRQH